MTTAGAEQAMQPAILHYSEDVILAAAKTYYAGIFDWRYRVAVGVVILLQFFATGQAMWVKALTVAVLIISVALPVIGYFTRVQGALTRFRKMKVDESTLEADDGGLHIANPRGSYRCAWNEIPEVWRSPAFWLLFIDRYQYITLPLADLDQAQIAYLESRLKVGGCRFR